MPTKCQADPSTELSCQVMEKQSFPTKGQCSPGVSVVGGSWFRRTRPDIPVTPGNRSTEIKWNTLLHLSTESWGFCRWHTMVRRAEVQRRDTEKLPREGRAWRVRRGRGQRLLHAVCMGAQGMFSSFLKCWHKGSPLWINFTRNKGCNFLKVDISR